MRKKSSEWRLFVSHVFKLLIYKTQKAGIITFMLLQNAYNRCVLFHMMGGGNRDLCGDVTELHGLCGR